MPRFRCFIRGENFPADVDGERQLLGFYVTRIVEARDEEDAEQVGLELLRGDEWLQGLKQNLSPDDPPAMIHFEEIELVDEAEEDEPPTGFSFFEME